MSQNRLIADVLDHMQTDVNETVERHLIDLSKALGDHSTVSHMSLSVCNVLVQTLVGFWACQYLKAGHKPDVPGILITINRDLASALHSTLIQAALNDQAGVPNFANPDGVVDDMLRRVFERKPDAPDGK